MSKKPFSEVTKSLRQLAADHPDQYAECRYFDGSVERDSLTPCCIVGHHLASIGVTHGEGYQIGDHTIYPLELNGARIGEEGEGVFNLDWQAMGYRKPTDKQLKWVSRVQHNQDTGDTWGNSVRRADRP